MKTLIKTLKEKGLRVSAAESCTGGLVSKLLTDVSGASEVFECSVTTYSNEAKMKLLGVKKETLENFGAVSEETAREMASGVRNLSGADVAVSVTGIAGPTGAVPGKPVGTVCIGIATDEKCYAKTFLFDGSRAQVRRLSAKMAIKMVKIELGIEDKKEKTIKNRAKKQKQA